MTMSSQAVGKDTHYLRRRINVREAEAGDIAVSDVSRLLAFLKATKTGEVSINQMGKTSVLHVACGKSTLQLPTSSYLTTQKQLPLIERLVNEGEKNMWQKWASFSLDCHGIVNGEDFAPAAQFDKVIGGNSLVRQHSILRGNSLSVQGLSPKARCLSVYLLLIVNLTTIR